MAFNITGRIVLQGPANVQQITSQIQSQLGSINTQIKVDLSPSSIAAINQLTVSVNQLNANIGNLNVSLGGVAVTAQRTGASLSAVNTPLTQLGTTANQTSKALVQIDTISKQAGDSVGYFGEQSALATRRFLAFSIAAGALIGTIAAIKSGISDAISFQNEMIKLAQVSNDSASQIRGVANEITNLSQRYGVSSRELAQASVTLRQAGYSAEEVKKALESLSQAALSPNFDTFEKNTQGAIAVMSQFKLGAADLSRSMSAINSVAAEFAVSAKDIQDGVIRAGGSFSAIGGNLNEFIALFTSVKHTTQESAEAVSTGLRTIFSRLQSRATLDSLQAMQIQLRYTAAEARALGNINLTNQFIGPYQAVQRIGDALRALPSTDQRYANIVEAIGGTRNVSRALPLIQDRDSQGRSIQQRALDIANNSGLSLSSSAEKSLESLSRQASIVFEKFQEFYRLIGDSSGFQTLARSLLQVAGGFAEVLKVAAPIVPLFTVLAATNIVSGGIRFGQAFADKISTPHFAPIAQQTPRFARGGYASGGLSALTPGEAVLSPSQTSSIGVNALNHLNGGGAGFMVPGVGNQDSELYNLAAGSYVIRKDSVNKIGKGKLGQYAGGGPLLGEALKSYSQTGDYDKGIALSDEDLLRLNNHFYKRVARVSELPLGELTPFDNLDDNINYRGKLAKQNILGRQAKESLFEASRLKQVLGASENKFSEGGDTDTVASLLKQIEESEQKKAKPKGLFSGLASILGYNRDGVTVQDSVNLGGKDQDDAVKFAKDNYFRTIKQLQFQLAQLGVNKHLFDADLSGSDAAIIRQASVSNPEFNKIGGSVQTYIQDAVKLASQADLTAATPQLLQKQAQFSSLLSQIRAYKRGQSTSFTPSIDIPTAGRAGSLEGISASVASLDRSIFPYDIPTAQVAPPIASLAPPVAEIAPIPTAKIINSAGKGKRGRVAEAEGYVVSALASGIDEGQIYQNLITNYGLAPSTAKLRLRNAKKGGRDVAPLGIPVADFAPPQFASGGSTRDTIPAMLTPGEFVFSPEAVSRIGVANLDRVNKGGTIDHIRGYNKGGAVRGYATGSTDGPFGPESGATGDLAKIQEAFEILRNIPKGSKGATEATVKAAQILQEYFSSVTEVGKPQNPVASIIQNVRGLNPGNTRKFTQIARDNPLNTPDVFQPDLPQVAPTLNIPRREPELPPFSTQAAQEALYAQMGVRSPFEPPYPAGGFGKEGLFPFGGPGVTKYQVGNSGFPYKNNIPSQVNSGFPYRLNSSISFPPPPIRPDTGFSDADDRSPGPADLRTGYGFSRPRGLRNPNPYGIPPALGDRPSLESFAPLARIAPPLAELAPELPKGVAAIYARQTELEKIYRKQVDVTSKGASEEEKRFAVQRKINQLVEATLNIETNKVVIAQSNTAIINAQRQGLDTQRGRTLFVAAQQEKDKATEANFHLQKFLNDNGGGSDGKRPEELSSGQGFFGRLFGKGSDSEASQARRQFGATTALVASSYLGDALSRAGGTADEAARNGTGSAFTLGRAFSNVSTYGGIGLGLGGPIGGAIGAGVGLGIGAADANKELKISEFGLQVERSVLALNNLVATVDRLGQRLNDSQIREAGALSQTAVRSASSAFDEQQTSSPFYNALGSIRAIPLEYTAYQNTQQGQGVGAAFGRAASQLNLPFSSDLENNESLQQRDTRLSSINRQNPAIAAGIERRLRDFVRNQRVANPNISVADLGANVNREFNTSVNGRPTDADILANSRGITGALRPGARFLNSDQGVAATNQAESRQLILSGTISATHDLEIGLRRFNTSVNQTADSMESLGKDLNSLTSLISGGGQLTRYNASTSVLGRPLDTPDYRNAVQGVTGGLGPVGDTLRASGLLSGRLATVAPDLLRRYVNNTPENGTNPELEQRTRRAVGIADNDTNSQEARIVRNFVASLTAGSSQNPQHFYNSGVAREELVQQTLAKNQAPLVELATIQERIINQQIGLQQRILDLYKQRVEHISRAADIEADFARTAAQQTSIRQFGGAGNALNNLTDQQVNAGFYSRINELGRPVGVNDRTSLQDIGAIGTQAIAARRAAQDNNNLSPRVRSETVNRFDAQLRSVIDVLRIYENSTQRVAFVNEQLAQNSRERSSRIEGQRRLILGSDEDRAESAFGASISQYINSQGNERSRQTGFNQLGLPGQQSYLRYADQFADVQGSFPEGNRSLRDEANARLQGTIGTNITNPLNAAQDALIGQMRSLTEEQAQANRVMADLIQATSNDVREVQLTANTEALRTLTQAINTYGQTQRATTGGLFSRPSTEVYSPSGPSAVPPLAGIPLSGGGGIGRIESGSTSLSDIINTPLRIPSLSDIGISLLGPGSALGAAFSGFATGGMVYASNGMFQPKGTDTVPAMLTPGEMVVNAASTAANRELLEHINNLKGPINKTLYRPIGGAVYAEVDARREEERRAAATRANNPNYIDVGGRTPFEVTPTVAGYYSRDNSSGGVYDVNTRKQVVYRADGGEIQDEVNERDARIRRQLGNIGALSRVPNLNLAPDVVNRISENSPEYDPEGIRLQVAERDAARRRQSGYERNGPLRGVSNLVLEQEEIRAAREERLAINPADEARVRFREVENARRRSVGQLDIDDELALNNQRDRDNNDRNELRGFRGQFNPLGFQNDINQIGAVGAARNYQSLANQNLLRQQLLGQTQTSGAFGGAFGGQLGFGQRQSQASGLGTLASINRRFLTQQPLFGSPNNLLLNNLRTRRFATGGHVDGPSGTDTIPAYLSNGEYVMSAGATRSIGPQNLAQIQRFAEGGLVGNTGGTGVAGALANPELTSALLKFSSESGNLSTALLSFSQQNQELVEAMKAFPHTITMTATHNVNVTHNGADVFATLEPEFKDLAVSTTKDELNKFIKDKFPDLA